MTTDIIPVPMLSTTGWTTSLSEKADAIASHFFESDPFQSNMYRGKIANLQYIVEQWYHDPVILSNNLRQTLQTYLARYYQACVVDVSTDALDPTNVGSKVTITLRIQVTEQGQDYSFGYLISTTKSAINKIIRMNDYGQTA